MASTNDTVHQSSTSLDAMQKKLKQLNKNVQYIKKELKAINKERQKLQDDLDKLRGKPTSGNRNKKSSTPNDQLRINHEPSKNGMGILVKYDEYTSKLTRNKSSKNRSKRKLSDESTTNEPLADTHKRRSKRLKRRRLNKCNNNNNIVDLCSD